jgi:hypothetical protein
MKNRRSASMLFFLKRIITTLLLDTLTSGLLSFFSVYLFEQYYNSHHSIKDPVARGVDLGLPIFAFYNAFLVFVFSFIVLFFVFYKITK